MKTPHRIFFALISCFCFFTVFVTACATSAPGDGTTAPPSSSETASASPSDSAAPAPSVSDTGTPQSPEPSATSTTASAPSDSIVYHNATYGFDFYLPESWEGYTVVTDTWEGQRVDGNGDVVLNGPKLLIRSPDWTSDTPTQDIPILIFTPEVWDQVQQEQLAVSAAPIPPSELGRNSKYVFALPARYNFAYLPGWEEVQSILDGGALKPTENLN